MPPIANQLLARPIESLRSQVSELGSSRTSDEAYHRMIEMHKSVLQILENVNIAIENSENEIAESESRLNPTSRRPLSESRCVNNLKILGSDKSEFKW